MNVAGWIPIPSATCQAFQRVVLGADPTVGERYDHLTLDERKLIFQLREAKMSVPRIAERLGRHRCTHPVNTAGAVDQAGL